MGWVRIGWDGMGKVPRGKGTDGPFAHTGHVRPKRQNTRFPVSRILSSVRYVLHAPKKTSKSFLALIR